VDDLTEDIRELVSRIQLGGERGRKLMLRTFLRTLMAGNPEAGVRLLQAAIDRMPENDRKHVLFVIGEVTSALTYRDD
jgi:hypothetical protein